MINILVLF